MKTDINKATEQAWRVAKLVLFSIMIVIVFFGLATPGQAVGLGCAAFCGGAVHATSAGGNWR
jgi:hypothetical protein